MPKRHGHVPGSLLHKPSGQARVIIDGKHIYLGEYGSPESREKYARLMADFSKPSAEKVVGAGKGSSDLSINEMLVKYYDFAKSCCVKNGEPTQELASMAEALLPLRQLYGHTRAAVNGVGWLLRDRRRVTAPGHVAIVPRDRRIGPATSISKHHGALR